MAEDGKRRVQAKGLITLPQDYREDNDIEPGDYVKWKIHSRDNSKLIIKANRND